MTSQLLTGRSVAKRVFLATPTRTGLFEFSNVCGVLVYSDVSDHFARFPNMGELLEELLQLIVLGAAISAH